MDCSQLESQSNGIDVYSQLNDHPSDFSKGLDVVCDTLIASPFQVQPIRSDSYPIIQPEGKRYCKDHTAKLNQIMKGEKA